jgi:hypothetical protein
MLIITTQLPIPPISKKPPSPHLSTIHSTLCHPPTN